MVNANNATSNNKQTTKLDQLDHTFEKENQVQCFNHTLQLSAKALLKLFNTGLAGVAADGDNETHNSDNDPVMFEEEEEGEGDKEEQGDEEGIEDDNIDELEKLSEDEQNQLPQETTGVCKTVTKVHLH